MDDEQKPIDITQGVKGFIFGAGYGVFLCTMMIIILAGCSGTIDRNGVAMMSYGLDADMLTHQSSSTFSSGTR